MADPDFFDVEVTADGKLRFTPVTEQHTMRCDRCHGKGTVTFARTVYKPREWGALSESEVVIEPCPACGGAGMIQCCENERGEPEEETP